MKHEFIDIIPDDLEEEVLYISIKYATAIHKCVCGCKNEVVTPFSPSDWFLVFDGQTVSLSPSIGNWSFPCQSHYYIRKNKVIYARKWTKSEIDSGRKRDLKKKSKHVNKIRKNPLKWMGFKKR